MSSVSLIALIIATTLALHGWRKGSLSPGGAAAAFIIGFLMLAVPLRTFGISLIVFYLIGSRATKYGKSLKATLEEGFHEAGYRSAWQVLCNSFAAFIATVIWSVLFAPRSIPWTVASALKLGVAETSLYAPDEWCPLSRDVSDGASRALLFATLGHFACCLGDTLASELGILSSTPPILVTTLKPVPPGTNGAISLGGTLASIAGGLIMGFTMFAALIVENSRCREEWVDITIPLLMWGASAGGFGSLLDSILGATIQRTCYSSETMRIFQDYTGQPAGSDVKVISGINILTNNQVRPPSRP
ncbi:hypothetical protein PILCRDRAFT_3476 [Piloderma croceum F 1598]|uniref:Transmembrane protein 19 n=1 Tax=Piloderma croceum (strain F 1598) TaxID=765440 RepID=A0A0C3CDD4_PILCF|nr:hypothetical protein PILCRDRAFT_3476 [Piloderma croceum F 1598]